MRRPAVAAAALLLAACAGAATDLPGSTAPPPACDARRVQRWIGRTATAAMLDTARVEGGAAVRRTIVPGTKATMDHRPDRLTIRLDADGNVASLSCG